MRNASKAMQYLSSTQCKVADSRNLGICGTTIHEAQSSTSALDPLDDVISAPTQTPQSESEIEFDVDVEDQEDEDLESGLLQDLPEIIFPDSASSTKKIQPPRISKSSKRKRVNTST